MGVKQSARTVRLAVCRVGDFQNQDKCQGNLVLKVRKFPDHQPLGSGFCCEFKKGGK